MQLRRTLFSLFLLLITAIPGFSQQVRLTEVQWHGTGCYKIEMPMGTVYFEKDNGVSGFKSFLDRAGNDWIASHLPPGPNGEFRGFPNSVGNFGHAGRDSGSTTSIVDGRTEGDVVILESSNADFTFQYWFFPDRVAIKVLKSKGDYCFLLECVAGGTADADDYFVTADGAKHIPSGEFRDFSPEWLYVGDPKGKDVLFFAKTPDDDAPNENHRQIRPGEVHNMDLYSFGRTGQEQKFEIRGMSGNDHVCVIGFTSASRPHIQISQLITKILNAPFAVKPLRWGDVFLRQKPEWYASATGRSAADTLLLYQSAEGAWPKNTDLVRAPASPEALAGIQSREGNTIDNGATIMPLRFLALMYEATGDERYRAAFARGVDYLFAAQYPNGGWPQYYPLRPGYYSHITYNDNAMVGVLVFLRDLAAARAPLTFIGEAERTRSTAAIARGVDCILKTQIIQDGKPTVWCAQHDENTLEPAWARTYEPPSLSGNESVGIVRFLMQIEQPTPEIIAAVDGAVKWFASVAITGTRIEKFTGADGKSDRRVVADPAARPMWARFYELGTNRPLFMDRDSEPRYAFDEIDQERRSGYGYHGSWPGTLVKNEYARWRAKLPANSTPEDSAL